ncbi:hypothetical protein [Microvirga terrestris]|uniref:Uncharacterized protein n=1 Tax=Microvirga terrestris TaxID=2791024 RepID=A0ABS0HXE5_9HYPH|nr:hypothetical protein [Microvirga terrestris]MBF9198176.1 hypothetical protein [Microvirga terrestris]
MRFWPLRDKTLVLHAGALSGGGRKTDLFGQVLSPLLPSLAGTGAPGAARDAP